MTRREALSLAAAGLVGGPAVLASEPRNLSYPLQMVEGNLTPPNRFFLRSHFSEPDMSLESWKLKVEGRVNRPYELSFSDLLELPSTQLEAVLECAGNTAGGSAVSNGVWEGVPLPALIDKAGVQSGARFVMLEGADEGRLFDGSPALPFAQLVPIEKCMEPTSLAAYKLNDLFLPKGNGFPARAVFPGWYAMDSVKWLRRMVVLNDEDNGSAFIQSGMNRLYNRTFKVEGGFRSTRLTSIQVKSAIAWPTHELKLPAGKHSIWGFAWTGNGLIRQVSVSTDAGQTWSFARLEDKPMPNRWVRWSCPWKAERGDSVLLSRATDDQGGVQPLERDRTRKDSYELNSCLPVRCSIR